MRFDSFELPGFVKVAVTNFQSNDSKHLLLFSKEKVGNTSRYQIPSSSLCRQKLRKYVRNEFEKDAEKFRLNPDEPDDVEEEAEAKDSDASDDESDDEKPAKAKGKLGKSRT